MISDEYIADHVGDILNVYVIKNIQIVYYNYGLKGCLRLGALANQLHIILTENLASILLSLLVEFYFYKHSERTIHLVLFDGCVSLFAPCSDRPPSMNHQQLGHIYVNIVTINRTDHSSNRCTCAYIKKIRTTGGQLWSVFVLINNRKQETRNNPLTHCIDHFMYNNMLFSLNIKYGSYAQI